jgi:hypothetical protein
MNFWAWQTENVAHELGGEMRGLNLLGLSGALVLLGTACSSDWGDFEGVTLADAGATIEARTVSLNEAGSCLNNGDCAHFSECADAVWCNVGSCLGNRVDLDCVAARGGRPTQLTDAGASDVGHANDAFSADAGSSPDVMSDALAQDTSPSGNEPICGVVAGPSRQPPSLGQCLLNWPFREGWTAIQPWMVAVVPPGMSSCTVRMRNIRVTSYDSAGEQVGQTNLGSEIVWSNVREMDPWFPLTDESTPVPIEHTAGYFVHQFNAPAEVLHFGPKRIQIIPGERSFVVSAELSNSTCAVQLGVDQYQSMTADPNWGVTHTELSLSDWVIADGCSVVASSPDPSGACLPADSPTTGPPPVEPPPEPTGYRDQDGDGYGTGAPIVGGTAALAGDCDDTRASVNPGRAEICNGRDDDCDGATDEDGVCGPTSSNTTIWNVSAFPNVLDIGRSSGWVIFGGTIRMEDRRTLSQWGATNLRATFWAPQQTWNNVAVRPTRFTVDGEVYFAFPLPVIPEGLTPYRYTGPSHPGARSWPTRFGVHSVDEQTWISYDELWATGAIWTGFDDGGECTSSLAVSKMGGVVRFSGEETGWWCR